MATDGTTEGDGTMPTLRDKSLDVIIEKVTARLLQAKRSQPEDGDSSAGGSLGKLRSHCSSQPSPFGCPLLSVTVALGGELAWQGALW